MCSEPWVRDVATNSDNPALASQAESVRSTRGAGVRVIAPI